MSARAMAEWRASGCPPFTVAVGRFRPGGPIGYRLANHPAAPVRSSRKEAEGDEPEYRTYGRAA